MNFRRTKEFFDIDGFEEEKVTLPQINEESVNQSPIQRNKKTQEEDLDISFDSLSIAFGAQIFCLKKIKRGAKNLN